MSASKQAPGHVPVIAIDGPSASGKGTVAARVAQALGWHYLDSGAVYRALAYVAWRDGIVDTDIPALVAQAHRMGDRQVLRFEADKVIIDGVDAGPELRSERGGDGASRLAVFPEVRAALLDLQHAFEAPPGLVADGRDMGTVVFPGAVLKVFLTASAEERATRRFKQLSAAGLPANFENLLLALRQRDERDRARSVAPLVPAKDAQVLETTGMSIDQVVDQVLQWYRSACVR